MLLNLQFMDSDLKKSINRLKEEIEKDIYFFGACGFVVGILIGWQERWKEFRIFQNSQWASEVFKDFLSVNAFVFVFVAYVILAWIRIILDKIGCVRTKLFLEKSIENIGVKLHQFGSSIISFAVGFALYIFLFSFILFDANGIKLFVVILLFSLFIGNIVVLAEFSAKIKDVSIKTYISLSILLLIIYLLIQLFA